MCNIKPYTDAKTEIRVKDAAVLAPMKKTMRIKNYVDQWPIDQASLMLHFHAHF